MEKTEVGATWASRSLLQSHWSLDTAPRTLLEAPRRLQELSGRLQDGPKSAPGVPKTAPRALRDGSKSAPGGSKTPQELSGRLQDGPKSAPGGSRRLRERSGKLQDGFKSNPGAPRALWEASRRRTQAFKLFKVGVSSIAPSHHLEAFIEPHQAYLNSFERLRIDSASPKVSVQKSNRRSCSTPLSSSEQASGQLAPCMAMHGSTLV